MKKIKNILFQQVQVQKKPEKINNLYDFADKTLFVVNENNKLEGTLTDGDIRRGILNKYSLNENVKKFMNKNFISIKTSLSSNEIKNLKKENIYLIPMIDNNGTISKIIDLKKIKSILPLSVLIMAGGKGNRLKPITLKTPKPLIKIGNKPIIEHNIDNLINYGVTEIFISVRYLKDQIIEYFTRKSIKNIKINFIEEEKALGTIGAVKNIKNFKEDNILVMNSDLLTNINFEKFYNHFIENNAKMSIVTTPYEVNIPFGVIESENNLVTNFQEKPNLTFYSNAGIYLINKNLLKNVPKNKFYNSTDLMEILMKKKELISYKFYGYWLDIGNPNDLIRAKSDIDNLNI